MKDTGIVMTDVIGWIIFWENGMIFREEKVLTIELINNTII